MNELLVYQQAVLPTQWPAVYRQIQSRFDKGDILVGRRTVFVLSFQLRKRHQPMVNNKAVIHRHILIRREISRYRIYPEHLRGEPIVLVKCSWAK